MASFVDLTLAETDSDSILSIDSQMSESSHHNYVDTVKQEMVLDDDVTSPLNTGISSSSITPAPVVSYSDAAEDGACNITSDDFESDTEGTYRVSEDEDSDRGAKPTEEENRYLR